LSEGETPFVLDEIIKPHNCKERMPTKPEGEVMATADGAAHFLADFYTPFAGGIMVRKATTKR